MYDDSEHHLSCTARSILSWFRELSLFCVGVPVQAGRSHDLKRCQMELTVQHTSGPTENGCRLSLAKLPLTVEFDMSNRSTSDVELAPFACNE